MTTRHATLIGVVVAMITSSAWADDSWMGWRSPPDGQANGIDVSFVASGPSVCTNAGGPFITMHPRVRSRYQERVTAKLKIQYENDGGGRSETTTFDLPREETKDLTATKLCHDTRRPLAVVIIDFRFPERDAEQKRIADQKAAADRAAAERAAAQKAATQKLLADQAATEAARRRQATQQQTQTEEEAQRAEDERRARERQQVAAADEEKRRQQLEAESTKYSAPPPSDDKIRHGEVSFQFPVGYHNVQFGTVQEDGLAIGARIEIRGFKWFSVSSGGRGDVTGTGFEGALGGGIATVTDFLQTASVTTRLVSGFARARIWRDSFAFGLFGELNRYSHGLAGGGDETQSLVAIGPEIAFGLAASRTLSAELGGRVGAVGTGLSDLTVGVTQDVYASAYAVAELNFLYGGAVATRYHELSFGGVPSSWCAMGVIGGRIPF